MEVHTTLCPSSHILPKSFCLCPYLSPQLPPHFCRLTPNPYSRMLKMPNSVVCTYNLIICACRYDPQSDRWSYIAQMATPRIGVGVATVNRLLYAVGGYDGTNRLSSVECYTPEEDKWKFIASMNVSRSGAGRYSAIQTDLCQSLSIWLIFICCSAIYKML